LPDGSGFIVARRESNAASQSTQSGVLYRYTFADEELTEIVRLPGEVIGKFAIAPNGAEIVFERGAALDANSEAVYWGPTVLCPCELWRVDSDGDGLERLVADGRAPAWSTTAAPGQPSPNPNLSPRVWLPFTRR
jgi:hypothetical protein